MPAETDDVIGIECAGTLPPFTVTTSVNLGADRIPNRKHRATAIEHLEPRGFQPADGRYAAHSRQSLVHAWLDRTRFEQAHPDLRDYHAAHYRALAAAFGVDLDLDLVPDRDDGQAAATPAWLVAWLADHPDRHARAIGLSPLELDRRSLHGLLTTTRDFYLRTSSPFERYLETPATIVAFGRHYGERIGNPLEELRAAYFDLMCELVGCVYGVADDPIVSDDDLRAHGFDLDERAPEPLDYW
jgi:hypothetical protein